MHLIGRRNEDQLRQVVSSRATYRPRSTDVFAKRVERLDAERALQVQIDNQVKKFHQYEYEIYEYRMKQITMNIQINNLKREIDKLV
jgi:hypothetical protein